MTCLNLKTRVEDGIYWIKLEGYEIEAGISDQRIRKIWKENAFWCNSRETAINATLADLAQVVYGWFPELRQDENAETRGYIKCWLEGVLESVCNL